MSFFFESILSMIKPESNVNIYKLRHDCDEHDQMDVDNEMFMGSLHVSDLIESEDSLENQWPEVHFLTSSKIFGDRIFRYFQGEKINHFFLCFSILNYLYLKKSQETT